MGSSESDGGSNPASDEWHIMQVECHSDQFCDPDGTPYHIPLQGMKTPFRGTNGSDGKNDTKKITDSTLTFQNIGGVTGAVGAQEGHIIIYRQYAKCGSDEETTNYVSGKDNITVEYILEGGAVYCGDNQ